MNASTPVRGSVFQFEPPPALVIVGSVLVLATLASFVLPKGSFQREERNVARWVHTVVQPNDDLRTLNERLGADLQSISDLRNADGSGRPPESLVAGMDVLVPVDGSVRNVVIPGTYQPLSDDRADSLGSLVAKAMQSVALAPIKGFVDKATVIAFVLMLGGSFGVILSTGAVDRVLTWIVLRFGEGMGKHLVIPASFTLFSLGGAVYGMGEDTIALVLITVPFAIRLGYDTLTGIAMCYMASQVGFAGAFFNPFTVGIAQGIAELPYLSGLGFRYLFWAIVTGLGIAFTIRWARRVERHPELSPTFAMDEVIRCSIKGGTSDVIVKPTRFDWLIVMCAACAVVISGYGVAVHGWFIQEMSGQFLGASMLCGCLARYTPRRISQEFIKGASGMIEPCLMIAVSAGIVIVLQEREVMDTILYAMSRPLAYMPLSAAAVAMMSVQAVLNFFVPSGSGQAAMTMPLIAPLCDILGLERQVGVLAFQFGDGFGNMVIPTSAVLMGVLGAAKLSWVVWVRWVLPFVLLLHGVAAVALVIATYLPIAWLQ